MIQLHLNCSVYSEWIERITCGRCVHVLETMWVYSTTYSLDQFSQSWPIRATVTPTGLLVLGRHQRLSRERQSIGLCEERSPENQTIDQSPWHVLAQCQHTSAPCASRLLTGRDANHSDVAMAAQITPECWFVRLSHTSWCLGDGLMRFHGAFVDLISILFSPGMDDQLAIENGGLVLRVVPVNLIYHLAYNIYIYIYWKFHFVQSEYRPMQRLSQNLHMNHVDFKLAIKFVLQNATRTKLLNFCLIGVLRVVYLFNLVDTFTVLWVHVSLSISALFRSVNQIPFKLGTMT